MTISERIFCILKERSMSQKEFGKKTGIAESTISDWKKKGTNPVSDKVLIISEVLGISPMELLSGVEARGNRSNKSDIIVINKSSTEGRLLDRYLNMNSKERDMVNGYIKAIEDLRKS